MAETSQTQPEAAAPAAPTHRPGGVRWRRMACGMALSAAAGVLLGQAWALQDASWWWLGGMTMLSAGLMVLSAVYARANLGNGRPTLPETGDEKIGQRWEVEPMLGEILVRNGVITPDELLLALARQQGTRLLLGEVLVDLRLVGLDHIEAALGEQSEWRDARRFATNRSQGLHIVAKQADTAAGQ